VRTFTKLFIVLGIGCLELIQSFHKFKDITCTNGHHYKKKSVL